MTTTVNGDSARQTQRTAYLGPEASFSHQAVVEALPHTQAVPLPSFKAILSALQGSDQGVADGYDFAVLPVENSTNGSVVQALDLVAQCGLDPKSSAYPDVEVIDEHYLEVHHCLFIRRSWAEQNLGQETIATLPIRLDQDAHNTHATEGVNGTLSTNSTKVGTAMSKLGSLVERLDIKTLYTHPQVWGQCNNVLSTLLPPGNVDKVDMSSTSAAAAFVASASDHGAINSAAGGAAAISSSLAGAKHKSELICLAENIEDEPGANTTRFLILCNKKHSQARHLASHELHSEVRVKSLWAFTVAHFIPGALAATLAVFAKHNFNLSVIQSRPKPKNKQDTDHDGSANTKKARDLNWMYVFFVECFHSRQADVRHHEDAKLSDLVTELQSVTEQVNLLGSWKARLS